MDYKAKYEQALDNFKKIKASNKDNKELVDFIEYEYPELKESKDEKIRKNIKIALMIMEDNLAEFYSTHRTSQKELFSWLEKQGKNNTDKIIERARTEKQRVLLTETKGDAHIDWDCRSLQDAKLLLEHGLEYIDSQFEKQGEQKPNFCHHEVNFSDCSEEYRKAYNDGWNNCNQQYAQLKAEQKPAWSEEDYDEMGVIACHLNNMGNEAMANSLLCIRDKYNNVKPKQEWSEEDEEVFHCLEYTVKHYHDDKDTINKCCSWLKSLKERMKGE